MLTVINGKVIETVTSEVDVIAKKELALKYRDIAAYHTKLADDLDAELAVPAIAAVITAKEAELVPVAPKVGK